MSTAFYSAAVLTSVNIVNTVNLAALLSIELERSSAWLTDDRSELQDFFVSGNPPSNPRPFVDLLGSQDFTQFSDLIESSMESDGSFLIHLDARGRVVHRPMPAFGVVRSEYELIVERELNRWLPETDSSDVITALVVRGDNNTTILEESASGVAGIGLRRDEVSAPVGLSLSSQRAWASQQLGFRGEARAELRAQQAFFDGRRWDPWEFVRVRDLSGGSDVRQLTRIRYEISGTRVECTLSLGSEERNFGIVQRENDRRLRNLQSRASFL